MLETLNGLHTHDYPDTDPDDMAATKAIKMSEAMRRTLTALGADASKDEFIAYGKKHFGVDFDVQYFAQLKSNAKASLKKEAAGATESEPEPEGLPFASPPPPPLVSAPAKAAKSGDVSIEDLEKLKEMKDLVARLGEDKVRQIMSLLK